MKNLAVIALILAASCPALFAAKPKPFLEVDLDAIPRPRTGCEVKQTTSVNNLLWMDDEHLAVSVLRNCYHASIKNLGSTGELQTIGTNGIVHSYRPDQPTAVLRGPGSTILLMRSRELDLMDAEFRTLQKIQCPDGGSDCSVFFPQQLAETSDFAICSHTSSEANCAFYKGWPAIQQSRLSSSIPIPQHYFYPGPYKALSPPHQAGSGFHSQYAWKPSESETWYFDASSVLTSLDVAGQTKAVTSEEWTPKDTYCKGEPSLSGPMRFLATCIGTHWYTDGELDTIFGFSRVALFDVASHRILARIDGPSFINTALSPSGKFIAISHDHKVRFYRVD